MKPTIKDVARKAGVSTATVSRVLMHSPKVTPDTCRRVLQAIEDLGFSPSRVARSLRAQRSPIIGMIISDIQNPFFTSIVRAVEDVARSRGYSLILCNSDEDLARETEYLELMRADRASGVIITPAHERGCAIEPLLRDKIPVVALDRAIESADVDTVLLDNVEAAYSLGHLLIRCGHRRIGAVLGPAHSTTGRERLEGFIAAHQAHHIEVDPALIYQVYPKEESGLRCVGRLLDLPEPPTAFFMGNNLLMRGALQAIMTRDLRIPDDIAVVSFDHMDWMPMSSPALTVVEQPSYQMGRRAVDLLFERIANPELPARKVALKGKIILRESHTSGRSTRVFDMATRTVRIGGKAQNSEETI